MAKNPTTIAEQLNAVRVLVRAFTNYTPFIPGISPPSTALDEFEREGIEKSLPRMLKEIPEEDRRSIAEGFVQLAAHCIPSNSEWRSFLQELIDESDQQAESDA